MGSARINVLELCAGYGGFSLGLSLTGRAFRTVCYVEREAYAAACLVGAMSRGQLDDAPIWSDLCTFDARAWRGAVDLVTAGFPCQPFSLAGKQLGEADERWIWPDIARIVDECRPSLVFLENVVLDAFRRPRADLENLGYRVKPALRVAASDVGAPHRRDRWFVLGVLADSSGEGLAGRWQPGGHGEEHAEPSDGSADVPDANEVGCDGRAGEPWPQRRAESPDGDPSPNAERINLRPEQRRTESRWSGATEPVIDGESRSSANANRRRLSQLAKRNIEQNRDKSASLGDNALGCGARDWWQARADVRRVSDECPDRVDRLRMLGNGVLPLAVAVAFDALLADACRFPASNT